MSLSKKSVAELAQAIRECRITAVGYANGNPSYVYPYFVGALESAITRFVQQQKCDSTEVRAAFEYEPTADELRDYQERQAKWRADDEARRAATGSAA